MPLIGPAIAWVAGSVARQWAVGLVVGGVAGSAALRYAAENVSSAATDVRKAATDASAVLGPVAAIAAGAYLLAQRGKRWI